MPAESKDQFRWLHTADAKKQLGKSGVKEWLGATGAPKELPERKRKFTRRHKSSE
jgi:hypothetical protein